MTATQLSALPPETRRQMAIRERLKGLGEVEILQAWYKGEETFELTPAEDAIRRRWDFAKAQFLALASYTETLQALQNEFGISLSQARYDVRHMRHAFGNLDEVPKALHRERAIEMALKAYKQAELDKDSDGMAKATKVYILAAGLDKDDTEKVDMEKLMQDRVYVEALDTQVRNFMLNFLRQGGGSVDTSQVFESIWAAGQGSEFVDYEEVPGEKDGNTDDADGTD